MAASNTPMEHVLKSNDLVEFSFLDQFPLINEII